MDELAAGGRPDHRYRRRATAARGGTAAAAGRRRGVAAAAVVAALAGPGAYAIATAATAHRGAIPSVGPSGGTHFPSLFDAPHVPPELTAALRADAASYTWWRGDRVEQRRRLPVGRRGSGDGSRRVQRHRPAPTLDRFQALVAAGRIHWFIDAGMPMFGRSSGSDAAQQIADWVAESFLAQVVGGVTVYDLSVGHSWRAHSCDPRPAHRG